MSNLRATDKDLGQLVFTTRFFLQTVFFRIPNSIAPDKDWRQLGIYPPLFGLIGYFKF